MQSEHVKTVIDEPLSPPPLLLPRPLAQDQALRALAEIRNVVDRSLRYSTFSALSGFVAGIAALAGSGLCGVYSGFVGTTPDSGMSFLAVWLAVFIVAAVSQVILTVMKARQRGEPVWTPIARTAFASLLGPGLAGVGGSAAFVLTQRWDLLPGLWLLFYGCGFWSVSFFAPLFLRILGVLFMILGLCAWAVPALSALWLGLGFGGLHFVFGAVIMTRYRE